MKSILEALNTLLERCDALSFEQHLKPVHLVFATHIEDSLDSALFALLKSIGYRGRSGSSLRLSEVSDWKEAITAAPFFDAGFSLVSVRREAKHSAASSPAHESLISEFIELVASQFRSPPQAFQLAPTDSDGNMLCPSGGCHFFLVLSDGKLCMLIDFDWDS